MAKQTAIASSVAALIATIAVALAFVLHDRQSAPTIVIDNANENTEIVVSVEGAVNSPGVYRLTGDPRLVDVIEAAGGLAADADLSRLNMAERIDDEARIVITSNTAASTGTPTAIAAGIRAVSANGELININTADTATLDTLPGIGPVLAERIVTYRETNGPFERIEELARVDGISAEMVGELRDSITVGP